MRRTAAAALVALSSAFSVLPATLPGASPAASAHEATAPAAEEPGSGSGDAPIATAEDAQEALAGAEEILEGTAPEEERKEATLAMRDLALSLPLLRGTDRARAEAILARPTDGADDPLGDGYTVPSQRKCKGNICVHWVNSTSDAPPSQAWVNTNLTVLNNVWRHSTKKMGYRKPLSDRPLGGNNGGNGKFDVYLADVGARGLYGYCVPEAVYKSPKKRRGQAISYCVLDNDFTEFGGTPKNALKVTAAHEMFHATQFAYDVNEDRWFMESTATWMEERFADGVNDNRQYLSQSQVAMPGRALDSYLTSGFTQYASWIFWEYLSSRYGNAIVRQTWERATPQGGDPYSIKALAGVLKKRGGFAAVFRAYSAANARPAASYAEGKSWPAPNIAARYTLGRKDSRQVSLRLNHLSAQHYVVKPAKNLTGKKWKLRVRVAGPNRPTAPGAYLYVNRKKGGKGTPIALNRKGDGATTIAFNRRNVKSVTITLVNASTRYKCLAQSPLAQTLYSCRGKPRDQRKPFTLTVATRR